MADDTLARLRAAALRMAMEVIPGNVASASGDIEISLNGSGWEETYYLTPGELVEALGGDPPIAAPRDASPDVRSFDPRAAGTAPLETRELCDWLASIAEDNDMVTVVGNARLRSWVRIGTLTLLEALVGRLDDASPQPPHIDGLATVESVRFLGAVVEAGVWGFLTREDVRRAFGVSPVTPKGELYQHQVHP